MARATLRDKHRSEWGYSLSWVNTILKELRAWWILRKVGTAPSRLGVFFVFLGSSLPLRTVPIFFQILRVTDFGGLDVAWFVGVGGLLGVGFGKRLG